MGSSEPLFNQMISISGPGGVPYKNSSEAQTFYESIAGNLGCCGRANIGNENFGKCQPGLRPDQPAIPDDFVECLLGKTTQEIQVFYRTNGASPFYDNIARSLENTSNHSSLGENHNINRTILPDVQFRYS